MEVEADRDAALRAWLREEAGAEGRLEPLAGDASFRRYLRLHAGSGGVFVVMDAPPGRENPAAFVRVAGLLRAAEVNAPRIFAADLERGFLLLEDFGPVSYLDRLGPASAPALYRDAFAALVRMQRGVPPGAVPPYDGPKLAAELELFPEWFLGAHLGAGPLPRAERRVLDDAFAFLVDAALAQPRVFVHRDYHSRNLMVHARNPGVLDFQDAVAGPAAYDAVSLLRDVYVAWPPARVLAWVDEYAGLAREAGVLPAGPPGASGEAARARFRRDFDLMGVQRHVKVAGIFARLFHRDGKAGYLEDVPLALRYLLDAAGRHPELEPFLRLLERRGIARLAAGALPCEP